MAELLHLVTRFVHVGAAMLWVGYLGFLAWVFLPAIRDRGHGLQVTPVLERASWLRGLGPLVFVVGFALIPVSGHSFAGLIEPGWGHAVLGAIVLATAMMGLEHGVVFPQMEKAREATSSGWDEHLDKAARAATVATVLGLVTALLMLLAGLGGF